MEHLLCQSQPVLGVFLCVKMMVLPYCMYRLLPNMLFRTAKMC